MAVRSALWQVVLTLFPLTRGLQVCGAVRDNGTVLIYGAMSGLTATYA